VIFEGLGALGSNVGVRGRFLVKKGDGLRYLPHPFGGHCSMFFGNFCEAVFEEAPEAPKSTEHCSKSSGFWRSCW